MSGDGNSNTAEFWQYDTVLNKTYPLTVVDGETKKYSEAEEAEANKKAGENAKFFEIEGGDKPTNFEASGTVEPK